MWISCICYMKPIFFCCSAGHNPYSTYKNKCYVIITKTCTKITRVDITVSFILTSAMCSFKCSCATWSHVEVRRPHAHQTVDSLSTALQMRSEEHFPRCFVHGSNHHTSSLKKVTTNEVFFLTRNNRSCFTKLKRLTAFMDKSIRLIRTFRGISN